MMSEHQTSSPSNTRLTQRRWCLDLASLTVALAFVAVEIRRVMGQVAVRYPDFFPAAEWASRFDVRHLAEWRWADGLYPMGYRLLLRLGVELGLNVLTSAFVLSILGGFLGLLGTFLLVRRMTGSWFLALLTETVLASTSHYLFFASLDSTDMLAAGLQIFSVAMLFAEERPRRGAFMAGLLAGLSYLIRYTASLTILLCTLYLVGFTWTWRSRPEQRLDRRRWWILPALYMFGAAAGAAPQLIASTLVKGNPFYTIQARNLWFHVTGGSDYIFEWNAPPEDLSAWNILLTYPRQLVTHWLGQLRGFWVSQNAVVLDAPFAPVMHAGLLFTLLVPNGLSRSARGFLGLYTLGNVVLLSLIRLDKRFLIVLMPLFAFTAVYFLWRILPPDIWVRRRSVPVRIPVMILLTLWSALYPLQFMRANRQDQRLVEVSNTLHAAGMNSADEVYSTHTSYQDVADPWKRRFPQAASIAPRLESYEELLQLLRDGDYRFLIYDDDTGQILYPDLEFLLWPESRPSGLTPVHIERDRRHVIYRVASGEFPAYRVTEARWANGISLMGYETHLSRDVPEREGRYRLGVYLHWQPAQPVPGMLKVFVHVLGSDGQLVAQHDGLPVLQTYNTDEWHVGETVMDFHQVSLQTPEIGESHTLRIGLYTEDEGRVPLVEPAGGDSFRLQTFAITNER
jgi:hypothetical protein